MQKCKSNRSPYLDKLASSLRPYRRDSGWCCRTPGRWRCIATSFDIWTPCNCGLEQQKKKHVFLTWIYRTFGNAHKKYYILIWASCSVYVISAQPVVFLLLAFMVFITFYVFIIGTLMKFYIWITEMVHT